ncbi:exodeoxyribonuclease VII small subunit [Paenibacillus zeisoli]|uniref:Exodeoxyribonuclease 7 small subunit n=1 Tax=Paenibacillus zeisoli TaxID=2496267 RepID=A0A433XQ69_9BACL|nr:exodeoxyribonuclease VII small subunit [Paenibacillus zeisoli]RUT36164.1 exodeoxyribonuclease VII small subunit [Paenibacillus zeisoli]
MEQEKDINFEEAMSQLDEIVSQLEHGDVPLETAIDLFQRGMLLSQLCGQKLAEVERKIEMIVESDGEITKKPFAAPVESGESGE